MEPIQLEPMAVIQAQRDRLTALTDENVQLTAAVRMLQQMIPNNVPEDNGEVTDVTDEVVGAEITS